MKQQTHIRELINRLARLDSAAGWEGDLNPTQRAALSYLSRANRFSRSPSHLSDYLGSTRGTVSQSLKSLLQKGYVSERRSDEDKRVISFELTSKGRKVANEPTPLEITLENLMADDQLRLQNVLTKTLQGVLEQNEGLEFGPCHKCIHHTVGPDGLRCSLLAVALTELEGDQICFEQESA